MRVGDGRPDDVDPARRGRDDGVRLDQPVSRTRHHEASSSTRLREMSVTARLRSCSPDGAGDRSVAGASSPKDQPSPVCASRTAFQATASVVLGKPRLDLLEGEELHLGSSAGVVSRLPCCWHRPAGRYHRPSRSLMTGVSHPCQRVPLERRARALQAWSSGW